MIWLSILVGAMYVNRLRGHRDWRPSWLSGHPLYYASAAMGVLVWPMVGWQIAIATALGYFVWGRPPWGRWYDIDTLPEDYTGPPTLFEKAIEAISFGQDCVAMFIRNLFVLPAVLAIGWFTGQELGWLLLVSVTFAAWAALAYVLGKLFRPKAPTIMAEYLVGLVWGSLVLAMWVTRI